MQTKKLRKAKSERLIFSDVTIKFLFQFSIGIGLALGFVIIVSYTSQQDQSPFYLDLNLMISGILGGLLYSMLIDQVLEFPSWTKDQAGLKPGFIGNMFVGIVGAFIAYMALPEPLKTPTEEYQLVGIMVFVTGLVGGYGGEYVLDAALKRFVHRVETVEVNKDKLSKINQIEEVQKLANQQIIHGLEPSKVIELQTKLKEADPSVKERIFAAAKDARRLGSRVKAYSDRINRTIPIFQSLVESNPQDDRYHAQLGCAYRDCLPPELDQAIDELDQAIIKRPPNTDNNWHYELDRVVAMIKKVFTESESESNLENSQLSAKIRADLQTIDQNYGLEKILLEFDEGKTEPIKNWLAKNQESLQQSQQGLTLLKPVQNQTDNQTKEAIPVINFEEFDWKKAPTNGRIRAIIPTYLKKQPIQSSELSEAQKVPVTVGQEYGLLRYAEFKIPETEDVISSPVEKSLIPESGLALIKEFEGYHEELPDGRARAYPDPGPKGWSLPTIGYGTTKYPNGNPVRKGDIITKAQAETYLMDYVDKKCRTALEKIPTWSSMNDNQRGALYSFAYNLGEGFYGANNFESITRVCDSPQRWPDYAWVREQFVKYVKADGKTLAGLVRRREAEAKLFCTPASSSQGTLTPNNSQFSEVTSAHCLVELDHQAGIWYIWSAHWDLPWIKKIETPSVIQTHSNPAVQRQIDRLSKYLPTGKSLNLDVKTKYFSQRDNYRDRDRSCNSSSNAMYLDWLMRVTGKSGLEGDNDYLRKVFSKGDTIYHGVQTWAIEQYGFKTQWMMDRDLPFVEDLIETGFPVVVNILHRGSISHPRGGHILMLIGRKNGYWIAHDPYGTLASNYRVRNGAYSQINESEFKKRWQGGYRTLREA